MGHLTATTELVSVVTAGFTKAVPSNFTSDFAPYGIRGVFNGAGMVLLSKRRKRDAKAPVTNLQDVVPCCSILCYQLSLLARSE